jgi:hypothetical protein
MKATITSTSGECTQFYAHHCFQGNQWYDRVLVHFQEVNNQGEQIEKHYSSKILGFFSIEGKCETVIQCSVKPLQWSRVERFFCQDEIGNKIQHFICYGTNRGSCTPIMHDSRLQW